MDRKKEGDDKPAHHLLVGLPGAISRRKFWYLDANHPFPPDWARLAKLTVCVYPSLEFPPPPPPNAHT